MFFERQTAVFLSLLLGGRLVDDHVLELLLFSPSLEIQVAVVVIDLGILVFEVGAILSLFKLLVLVLEIGLIRLKIVALLILLLLLLDDQLPIQRVDHVFFVMLPPLLPLSLRLNPYLDVVSSTAILAVPRIAEVFQQILILFFHTLPLQDLIVLLPLLIFLHLEGFLRDVLVVLPVLLLLDFAPPILSLHLQIEIMFEVLHPLPVALLLELPEPLVLLRLEVVDESPLLPLGHLLVVAI